MTKTPTTESATTQPPRLWAVLTGGQDGPALRVEHAFATTAEDLWRAVTDPERVSRWMAPTVLDGPAAVGARYLIDFGGDGSSGGVVTRCEAPTSYEVTWELAGEPDSVVLVEVETVADGAVLRLEHTRLPADQVHGHAAGWQAHLAALGALLEGGTAPDWDGLFGALLPAYRTRYPDAGAR